MANVVITGGSRGIGAAAVRAFRRRGDRMRFLYAKSHDAAQALAAETGAEAAMTSAEPPSPSAPGGETSSVSCEKTMSAGSSGDSASIMLRAMTAISSGSALGMRIALQKASRSGSTSVTPSAPAGGGPAPPPAGADPCARVAHAQKSAPPRPTTPMLESFFTRCRILRYGANRRSSAHSARTPDKMQTPPPRAWPNVVGAMVAPTRGEPDVECAALRGRSGGRSPRAAAPPGFRTEFSENILLTINVYLT